MSGIWTEAGSVDNNSIATWFAIFNSEYSSVFIFTLLILSIITIYYLIKWAGK